MEKKIREKEIFRKTITSDTEEVYEFVKYESDDYYRIYIRKYGERRGASLYYSCVFDLEKDIAKTLIENRILRLKLRDAKRALR